MFRVKGAVQSEHVRSVAWDLIWTILTCYLYSIYIQHRQILAVNSMLRQEKYSFSHWAIFTLLTCGLYHIYHEYRKSVDIATLTGNENSVEPALHAAMACFGFHMIADALQQSQINRFYGSESL